MCLWDFSRCFCFTFTSTLSTKPMGGQPTEAIIKLKQYYVRTFETKIWNKNWNCWFLYFNILHMLYCSTGITVRFRPLSPDGLIFYMPNNIKSPTLWMSLFLQQGYLHFNLQTSTKSSNTITSNNQYLSAGWTTLTILRYYNFAAMVCLSLWF